MPSLRGCFNLTIWLLIAVYGVVPLIVYLYPAVLSKVVFFYLYYCPHYSRNFSDFAHYGLAENCCRNFYLNNPAGHRLGVWQLAPEPTEPGQFAAKLNDGRPVLLYYHGNALNRGGRHMVDLYKKLLMESNVHILALDYRGYGDSEGLPEVETDVVDDAEALFKHVTEELGIQRVYLWGHSLGSGVVSHLAKRLSSTESFAKVAGIVLESPFNNIRDCVRLHHFSLPYRLLPYFEPIFVDGVGKCGIHFDSDANLAAALHASPGQRPPPPVLILHALDDAVVPLELGRRLHAHLLAAGARVHFLELPAGKGYRHTNVWKAPEVYAEFRRLLTETGGLSQPGKIVD